MNEVFIQDQVDDPINTKNFQGEQIRKYQKKKSMFSNKCTCRMHYDQIKQHEDEINLINLTSSSNNSNSSINSSQNNLKNDFNLGDSLSKAFFNFFPEGVAFIDSQMNLLYANDTLQKFFQTNQFNLLEKLFQLNNDLQVNELQKQKSEKAQNFILNNIVQTDQHIVIPKQRISQKMKSYNNIISQDIPQTSRKFSAIPFKNNQTQNNIVIPNQNNLGSLSQTLGKHISQQQQNQNQFKNLNSLQLNQQASNTPISKNQTQNQNQYSSTPTGTNHEGSLQQISQFANYILQSNSNTPNIRQKSNTSLTFNVLNRYSQSQGSGSGFNAHYNQQQYPPGSKKNISEENIQPLQLQKQNNKTSFVHSNTHEESIFSAHYPIQDSMSHINIHKKQAISPNLKEEIELILKEASQYMQSNSVEADCILDKSFTFTSRIVFSDIQKQGSFANQAFHSSNQILHNLNSLNTQKEQKLTVSDKQTKEDNMRAKKVSIDPTILQSQQQQISTQTQSSSQKNNQDNQNKKGFNSQNQNKNLGISQNQSIDQNQINNQHQGNAQNNLNLNFIHLTSSNKTNIIQQKKILRQPSQSHEEIPIMSFQEQGSLNSNFNQQPRNEIKTSPKIENNRTNTQNQNTQSNFEQNQHHQRVSIKDSNDYILKSDEINTIEKIDTIQQNVTMDQLIFEDNGTHIEKEQNYLSNLQLQVSPASVQQTNPQTNYDKTGSLTAIYNQKSSCSIAIQQQNNQVQQQYQQNITQKKYNNQLYPTNSTQQQQSLQVQQNQQTTYSTNLQYQLSQSEFTYQDSTKLFQSPKLFQTKNNTNTNTQNYINNNMSNNHYNFTQSIHYNKQGTNPTSPLITVFDNSEDFNNGDLLKYTNKNKQQIQTSNNSNSESSNKYTYGSQKSDEINQSQPLQVPKKTVLLPNQKYSHLRIPESHELSEKTQEVEWSEEDDKLNKSTREVDITIFAYIINQSPVILLLVRDVTHRSYIQLLQDVCKKKSKMVSFVSHELRTPLNSIIAMLETMKNKPDIDYIETALMNSKYLLSMSNDLLDLAQIKVNKFQIRKKTFNFKELIMEAMEMFQIQAQRQQIELQIDYSPDIRSFITSDKNRIRQVLINLIGNAFKFTLTGSITIKVEKINNSLFEVIVSDTGIGIKEGDLNKLFKTFGKVDGEESVKLNEQDYITYKLSCFLLMNLKQGVGLGLVISNMIAFSLSEEKEGLTVKSEYSKGTQFKFKILDQNISQSYEQEDQFIFQKNEEEEDNRMSIVAEEDEENNVIKNISQHNSFTISQNKFFEDKKLQRKTKKRNSTILQSSSESLPSPLKRENRGSNRNISSSKQYNTVVLKSSSYINKERTPIRLYTDTEIKRKWQEKRKSKQLRKSAASQDYTILTLNGNSQNQTDYDQPKNKLIKIATQINIKDEWGQILIVDDNMSNILAMKCLLNSINPELICNYAIRGQGAEDLVKNRFYQQENLGYSIIFMDIVMPEQDGIITAQKIKQFLDEFQITNTKIIACSGYDDEYEKNRCLEAGMIDYLVKPVFKDKLASVINMYLK